MSNLTDLSINGMFANFYSNNPSHKNNDLAAAGRVANRFNDINKVSEANARFIHDIAEQVIEDNVDNGTDSNLVLRKVASRSTFDKESNVLLRLTAADDNCAIFANNYPESEQSSAEELRKKRREVISSLLNRAAKHQKQATELSQAMDRATGQLQAATFELDTAIGSLDNNTARLKELKQQHTALQNELGDLSLAGIEKDAPRYIALKQNIEQAKNAINSASQTVIAAEAEMLKKLDTSQALITQHGDLIKQLAKFSRNTAGVVVVNHQQLITEEKKNLSFQAMVTLRMVQMQGIVHENNLNKLKNDRELSAKLMEATRTSLTEKARQFDEQQAKASEAAEKMSKCTKIFGGIATALGAMTMVFGGAGAPLMALGLGLLVADTVTEKLFGFSITEKVMGPLMDHVFMPLMNAIKDVVSAIFDHTPIGALLNYIDQKTGANMMSTLHTAVAAAATVAIIVAAAFILKSAGKVLYKTLGKSLARAVASYVKTAIKSAMEQMPKLLKNAGKSIKNFAQQTKQMLDELATKSLQKLHCSPANRIVAGRLASIAGEVVTLGDTTNRMANSIIIGQHNKQAHDALANYQVSRELLDHLTKKLNALLETLKKDDAEIKTRGEKISELIQSNHQARVAIVRAI